MSFPSFDPATMMNDPFHPHLASATQLAEVKVAWHMLHEVCARERIELLNVLDKAYEAVKRLEAEKDERDALEEDLAKLVKIAPKLDGLVIITGSTSEEIAEKHASAVKAHNTASKNFCRAAERASWARDESQICDAFIAYTQMPNSQEARGWAIFNSYGLYPVRDSILARDARLAYWKDLAK